MRSRSQETLAGAYHSAFKGSGMQFCECKAYEEGDDVRYIDWNASARQNGVFVKRFIEERELNVCIILDLSSTMRFGSVGMTKAEKAIEAMSILSLSALQNNDKVNLFMFNEVGMKYIPKIRGKSNTIRLIIEAMKFSPEPGTNTLNGAMATLLQMMKRRAFVFIISDFIHPEYERTLRHLAHHHEVLPIVISDPIEKDMPDIGLAFIEDMYTGEVVLADTGSSTFRKVYRNGALDHERTQKAIFERSNLTFVRASTTEDITRLLMHAFDRRAGRV